MLRVLSERSLAVYRQFISRNFPGFPQLALVPVSSDLSSQSIDPLEIIKDFAILWGVPVSRTSRPKKRMRKYGSTRLLHPKENMVNCQICGEFHEIHTICGKCYEKVREETNKIKAKMMDYDPYKGEMPDKEIFVKYATDEDPSAEVRRGKRIVEINEPRPNWFSGNLLRKK